MAEEKSRILSTFPNTEVGRRDFFKIVGGGIIVFFAAESAAPALQGPPRGQAPPGMGGMPGMGAAAADLNAYLRIGEDGKVTVFSGKVELGQGNTTALAQMAAEELSVPLESVNMIMGDTDQCPWDMGTFGSMSIRIYGSALRSAAAEAKAVLLELASEQLKKPKSELTVGNGTVFVASDKKTKVTYAQLTKGQKITRKLDQKPDPKPAAEFTVIGNSAKRLDATAKITGKAQFAGDLRFPGLLYARLVRPPAHGAVLKSADTSAAEKLPGVIVVKENGMVAVLHENPEQAEKALAAVKVDFDVPAGTVDNDTIFDHLVKVATKPQQRERKGDLAEGEKTSVEIFEQKYLNGYGAHASIETHTACARLQDGKMTVWISTQTPFPNQQEIAKSVGLKPQDVRVITPYVGGGFGGKSAAPQSVEAAQLAKITGKPVQVSYTRAEEFFYDSFRPAAVVKIKSGLDRAGKISMWDYHVYYAGNRSAEQFYDVPHNLMSIYGSWMGADTKAHPFQTGAWRAPGANLNVFARESQIDIMAARAKADPLEFRLRNTSDPRMRRVLQVAAERFGYKSAVSPSGRGYGIACGIDAETYVAEIAEIKLDKGNIKVKRIVAVQDMGVVINPEGAKMQMEGCIMMGLGYSLAEDVAFKGGQIFTKNFDDYQIPHFSWLPEIEATLIKNDELTAKGGGEPAIVPVGGAIANALFDLAGVRIFQMPMTRDRINKALKEKA
jgi:nicotinate dehydrogenase subunit B